MRQRLSSPVHQDGWWFAPSSRSRAGPGQTQQGSKRITPSYRLQVIEWYCVKRCMTAATLAPPTPSGQLSHLPSVCFAFASLSSAPLGPRAIVAIRFAA